MCDINSMHTATATTARIYSTRSRAAVIRTLATDPIARAVYWTKDATGNHAVKIPVRIVDGDLVQPHPTDAGRGPISVPSFVRYSISYSDECPECGLRSDSHKRDESDENRPLVVCCGCGSAW